MIVLRYWRDALIFALGLALAVVTPHAWSNNADEDRMDSFDARLATAEAIVLLNTGALDDAMDVWEQLAGQNEALLDLLAVGVEAAADEAVP